MDCLLYVSIQSISSPQEGYWQGSYVLPLIHICTEVSHQTYYLAKQFNPNFVMNFLYVKALHI
ncbi:MAG: hypothetical protein MUE81_15670, partial [Thermoflexibacter sp.]|nr:hypothetical protein [Thermoflexibacter sp.]